MNTERKKNELERMLCRSRYAEEWLYVYTYAFPPWTEQIGCLNSLREPDQAELNNLRPVLNSGGLHRWL